MNSHRKKIWQGGPAREIMKEARAAYRESWQIDPVVASVAMASVHYSIAKRYMSWWQKPLAVWHAWQATQHAGEAASQAFGRGQFSLDQIDVITTILAKVPRFLGGDMQKAQQLLKHALIDNPEGYSPMKPHTRALMHLTLAELALKRGDRREWKDRYWEVERLLPAIEQEDSDDREYQLIRVRAAVGFYYCDQGDQVGMTKGRTLLLQAWTVAGHLAKDQQMKINAECKRRRFSLFPELD